MAQSVGIRELKQYTSRVVARVSAGEALTVTDRGRPVARLVPHGSDPVQSLVEAGLATPPSAPIRSLPRPAPPTSGRSVADELIRARAEERL
ncbi:MAG: type II toxin-antitoxin system prevent-host-death family antitoxin [Bifidobacteriaceae bacterium]|jgi:prevent-host-death family protein|nr:type II toxin-antitoxin system prevent-host-death family antitoxin [Bifidobacteriaceae bacterium]